MLPYWFFVLHQTSLPHMLQICQRQYIHHIILCDTETHRVSNKQSTGQAFRAQFFAMRQMPRAEPESVYMTQRQ